MKKIFQFLPVVFLVFAARSQPLSFTINNVTGSTVITCFTPSISLMAISNYTASAVSYSWVSSGMVTGSNVALMSPGNYTVTASAGTLTSSQIVSLAINTVVPVSSISPTLQNFACPNFPTVTITAISPTVNFTHNIYTQGGTLTSGNVTSTLQVPAGTHTYVLKDNTNGCMAIKQVTFTISGFPTFSIVSVPPGFTLGCSSKSVITVNFVNVQTSPPGGALTYSLFGPNSPTLISPGPTSPINLPGTYTAAVNDVGNSCVTKVVFSIISNTLGPLIDSVLIPRRILNCEVPSTTIALWVGGTLTYTVAVNTKTNTTPSNTVINIYTLTVTDNNSLCKSSTIVPMYQNLYPPIAKITTGGITDLCFTPTIVLTNMSSSGIFSNSIIPPPSMLVVSSWEGPSPQPPLLFSSSYIAGTEGTYTMTATDLNNGCTSTATINITRCVGLEESNLNQFQIYPNPTSGVFMIHNAGIRYSKAEIYNALGELILNKEMKFENEEIDIGNQTQGIYIVKLIDNNRDFGFSRILKQ